MSDAASSVAREAPAAKRLRPASAEPLADPPEIRQTPPTFEHYAGPDWTDEPWLEKLTDTIPVGVRICMI